MDHATLNALGLAPLSFKAGARRKKKPARAPVDPTPEEMQEQDSALNQIKGGALSAVGYVGGTLDKLFGGRAIRTGLGLLSGSRHAHARDLLSIIPTSDTIGLTKPEHSIDSRTILEDAHILRPNRPGLDLGDVIGFTGDVLTDPGTILTLGGAAVSKAGRIGSAAGVLKGTKLGERVGNTLYNTVKRLPMTERAAAVRKLKLAAKAEGVNRLRDVWHEPMQGLAGWHLNPNPFARPAPLGLIGTGPTAQKLAAQMDRLAAATSKSLPGRIGARIFDAGVRGTHSAPGQEAARKAAAATEAEHTIIREGAAAASRNLEDLAPHFQVGPVPPPPPILPIKTARRPKPQPPQPAPISAKAGPVTPAAVAPPVAAVAPVVKAAKPARVPKPAKVVEPPPVPPAAPTVGSVPMMMTHEMRRRLKEELHFEDAQIKHMTPAQAHELLATVVATPKKAAKQAAKQAAKAAPVPPPVAKVVEPVAPVVKAVEQAAEHHPIVKKLLEANPETANGAQHFLPHLRDAMRATHPTKAAFDADVLEAAKAGHVQLHKLEQEPGDYFSPMTLDPMVTNGKEHFNAISLPPGRKYDVPAAAVKAAVKQAAKSKPVRKVATKSAVEAVKPAEAFDKALDEALDAAKPIEDMTHRKRSTPLEKLYSLGNVDVKTFDHIVNSGLGIKLGVHNEYLRRLGDNYGDVQEYLKELAEGREAAKVHSSVGMNLSHERQRIFEGMDFLKKRTEHAIQALRGLGEHAKADYYAKHALGINGAMRGLLHEDPKTLYKGAKDDDILASIGEAAAATKQKVGGKTKAVQDVIDTFERVRKQFDMPDAVPVRPKTTIQQDTIRFMRQLGVQPVFFRAESSPFRGAAVPGKPYFFLKDDLGDSTLWYVAGHEAAHALKLDLMKNVPTELLAPLREDYLRRTGNIADPVARAKMLAKLTADGGKTLDREAMATFIGSLIADPAYRAKVMAKAPGIVQRIIEYVKKMFQGFTPHDKAAAEVLDRLRALRSMDDATKRGSKPAKAAAALAEPAEDVIKPGSREAFHDALRATIEHTHAGIDQAARDKATKGVWGRAKTYLEQTATQSPRVDGRLREILKELKHDAADVKGMTPEVARGKVQEFVDKHTPITLDQAIAKNFPHQTAEYHATVKRSVEPVIKKLAQQAADRYKLGGRGLHQLHYLPRKSTAPLDQAVPKTITASMKRELDEIGYNPEEIAGMSADQAYETLGGRHWHDDGGMQLSTGRLKSLRDIPATAEHAGETAGLNAMGLDKEISGPERLIKSPRKARDYILDKHLNVNAAARKRYAELRKISKNPDLDFTPAQKAEYGALAYRYEQAHDLMRIFSKVDPEQAAKGVPLFGHDPLVDALRASTSAARYQTNLEAVHDMLLDSAKRGGAGEFVSQAFKNAKMTRHTAMRHFAERLVKTGKESPDLLKALDGEDVKRLNTVTGKEYQFTRKKAMQRVGGYKVPGSVAADAGRLMAMSHDPEVLKRFFETSDKVTNFLKTHLTVPFPSFATRNLQTLFWQDAVTGGLDNPLNPASWAKMAKTWKASADLLAGKFDSPHLKEFLATVPMFKGMPPDEAAKKLGDLIFAHRVSGHGVDESADLAGRGYNMGGDIAGSLAGSKPVSPKIIAKQTADEIKGSFKEKLGVVGRVKKTLKSFVQTRGGFLGGKESQLSTWTPARIGERTNEYFESLGRNATFMRKLQDGTDAAEAGAFSRNIHVDYRELSDVERHAKRAIPFYTFTRRMVPWVLHELATHPGGATRQAVRLANKSSEGDFAPSYLAGGVAIPLGAEQPDGTRRYLRPDLPHEVLNNLLTVKPTLLGTLQDTGMGLASQLHPAIKGPLEVVTGKSTFQKGRSLSQQYSRIGTPNTLLNALVMNSPLSRYATEFSPLGGKVFDQRKSAVTRIANLLGPIKLSDPNIDKSREAAIRELASELLTGVPGVQKFEKTYASKEALAGMSPRERAIYAILEAQAKRARKAKTLAKKTTGHKASA